MKTRTREVWGAAKDIKAQDAMKNAGEMKGEGMRLKDAATGK